MQVENPYQVIEETLLLRPTQLHSSPPIDGYFGEHFMIDGYQCSAEKLNDQATVLSCLTELPPLLGMRPLSQPEIYYAPGGSPKDPGGWTGFVVIEESHISIHTFPKIGFVSIDAYTCRNDLQIEEIKKFFSVKLQIGLFETNFVRRGLYFDKLAMPARGDAIGNQGHK